MSAVALLLKGDKLRHTDTGNFTKCDGSVKRQAVDSSSLRSAQCNMYLPAYRSARRAWASWAWVCKAAGPHRLTRAARQSTPLSRPGHLELEQRCRPQASSSPLQEYAEGLGLMGWVHNVRRVAAAAAEACKRDGVTDPDQARAVLHGMLAEHVHPIKVGGWLPLMAVGHGRLLSTYHTYCVLLCARHASAVVESREGRGAAALGGAAGGMQA